MVSPMAIGCKTHWACEGPWLMPHIRTGGPARGVHLREGASATKDARRPGSRPPCSRGRGEGVKGFADLIHLCRRCRSGRNSTHGIHITRSSMRGPGWRRRSAAPRRPWGGHERIGKSIREKIQARLTVLFARLPRYRSPKVGSDPADPIHLAVGVPTAAAGWRRKHQCRQQDRTSRCAMMSAKTTTKHLDQASRAAIGTDERTRLPLVNTSQMPGAGGVAQSETSRCGKKRDTGH